MNRFFCKWKPYSAKSSLTMSVTKKYFIIEGSHLPHNYKSVTGHCMQMNSKLYRIFSGSLQSLWDYYYTVFKTNCESWCCFKVWLSLRLPGRKFFCLSLLETFLHNYSTCISFYIRFLLNSSPAERKLTPYGILSTHYGLIFTVKPVLTVPLAFIAMFSAWINQFDLTNFCKTWWHSRQVLLYAINSFSNILISQLSKISPTASENYTFQLVCKSATGKLIHYQLLLLLLLHSHISHAWCTHLQS